MLRTVRTVQYEQSSSQKFKVFSFNHDKAMYYIQAAATP